MKKQTLNTLALTSMAAMGLSISACASDNSKANPFEAKEMDTGYEVAAKKADAKCGEGKCGGKASTEAKKADAKCGEGKCGANATAAEKKADAKCGEGKCGGKVTTSEKKAEAKCGEGKCGGKK